jgi:tetratricopeptide (TPR) repeat protein
MRGIVRRRWAALVVAIVSIMTYANTLANGFAVDDDYVIRANTRVHSLADQASIWLTPWWPTYGEQLGLYRPLTIFSFAAQWAVGDGSPWVFHLVNVLLHAGVAVLVMLLLRRFVSTNAALAGALLFAVHPVHTEVVANVVGQAELLAAGAVLGACVVFAGRTGTRLRPREAAIITGLYALGLLAKEGAVVLPALLVVLDIAQRRLRLSRRSIQHWMRAVAPPLGLLLVVFVAYFALRTNVLGSPTGEDAAPWLSFLRGEARVYSALRIWPEYARLLFFPVDLSADYSPAVLLPASSFEPMVVLGAMMLGGVVALSLALPFRPIAGLPAAWFLIAVLPVSNLLIPIGVLMAERVLYLPSVAVSILAAVVWSRLALRLPEQRQRPVLAVAAAVLVLLAVRSFVRNPDWRDSNAYYAALLRDHPESYRAQWGVAAQRLAQGDLEGARVHMEFAHRLWPHDPQQLSELGLLYLWLRDYAAAVPLLERARELSAMLPRTWSTLAWANLGARRWAAALEAADGAERLGMATPEAQAVRAQAFEGLGQRNDAREAWQSVVSTTEGNTFTYWSAYARTLARAGERDTALAAADSARALAPDAEAERMSRLRAAIERGCFTVDAEDCADPLHDWWVVTSSRGLEAPVPSAARADSADTT